MKGCDCSCSCVLIDPAAAADEEQKKEVWRARPVYPHAVRIGNWNNSLSAEEHEFNVAGYKRDHCQLLIQRTRKMFKNLLSPVILAKQGGFVMYGSVYQIQACELLNKLKPETGYKASYGLYLAGFMNEGDLEIGQHFIHGCGLTLSPDKAPCVRNTFVFVGCDGQPDGQVVKYGENVYIRIYESGTDGHLFIQCENPTFDDFGGHLSLRLTQSPDFYCKFKLFHMDPKLRCETVGTEFASNTRVIITHTASGQNLTAECISWIPTFFGAECMVSCHTYRNIHKMETAENIWKIVTLIEPDMNLYVRVAKGEEIPIDLLN